MKNILASLCFAVLTAFSFGATAAVDAGVSDASVLATVDSGTTIPDTGFQMEFSTDYTLIIGFLALGVILLIIGISLLIMKNVKQ